MSKERFIRWDGWSRGAQIARLLHLAELCRPYNPARSDELLEWVEWLKAGTDNES